MSFTSRTGLLPTSKQQLVLTKKANTARDDAIKKLPKKLEATSIGLTLRPFDAIYNPYKKGCSLLCNHPAPKGIRDLIKQVKTTFSNDVKNPTTHQQALGQLKDIYKTKNFDNDNIPEDLFRRFTDTDSRPLTPTPTVISGHTLSSSLFNARRCITPEPDKAENFKRKQIILDLRRSHSQEALYWKPASEISQGITTVLNAAFTDTEERGDNKPTAVADTVHSHQRKLKYSKSCDNREAKPLIRSIGKANSQQEPAMTGNADHGNAHEQNGNDAEERNSGDCRRSKKRRKRRKAKTPLHLREDPETQIATLGPDSMNPSNRPSLIVDSCSLLNGKNKNENESITFKDSCLTEETFRFLKKKLDIDTIENTFGRYLNLALREATKYLPPSVNSSIHTKQIVDEKNHYSYSTVVSSKMPRKLSKSATCFEIPMDLSSLEKMTVLDYLSKNVWLSSHYKNLYKLAFLKYVTQHTEETLEDVSLPSLNESHFKSEYVERTMPLDCLPQALEDVLEFYGTEKNVSAVLRFLDYENLKIKVLDFRAWCGIVAFAERLAQHDREDSDSCNELEKADFNTMMQWLHEFKVPKNLLEVFRVIRSCHFSPFE